MKWEHISPELLAFAREPLRDGPAPCDFPMPEELLRNRREWARILAHPPERQAPRMERRYILPMITGIAAALIVGIGLGLLLVREGQHRMAQLQVSIAQLRGSIDQATTELRSEQVDNRRRLDALRRANEQISDRLASDQRRNEEILQTDTRLRNKLAESSFDRGRLYHDAGGFDEASQAYREAADVLKELAHRHPADPEARVRLSTCYLGLGSLLRDFGHLAGSEAWYREAAEPLESLVQRKLADSKARSQLAMCYLALGDLRRATGDYREADLQYAQALRIQMEVADSDPDSDALLPLYRHRLAGIYLSLGHLRRDVGKIKEASELFWKAERIASEGALQVIAGSEDQMADIYLGIGELQREAGKYEAAADSYEQALKFAKDRAHFDSPDAEQLLRLGSIYLSRGRLQQAQGGPRAASPSYLNARRRFDAAESSSRTPRAKLRAFLGRMAAAVAEMGGTRRGGGEGDSPYSDLFELEKIKNFTSYKLTVVERDFLHQLGALYIAFGDSLRERGGQVEQVKEFYREALGILEPLHDSVPRNVDYQSTWSMALYSQGLWFRDRGRDPDAIESLRRAIELQREVLARAPAIVVFQQRLDVQRAALLELYDRNFPKNPFAP